MKDLWESKTSKFVPRLSTRSKKEGSMNPEQNVVSISQWSLPKNVEPLNFILFLKDFIYLFLEKGEGKEKERERNINVWSSLTCSHWEPGPQPRHVPWLGMEPPTLWFTGPCSIHWAIPARAQFYFDCTFAIKEHDLQTKKNKWNMVQRYLKSMRADKIRENKVNSQKIHKQIPEYRKN